MKRILFFLPLLCGCAPKQPRIIAPFVVTIPQEEFTRAHDEMEMIDLMNQDLKDMDIKTGMVDLKLRNRISELAKRITKEQ